LLIDLIKEENPYIDWLLNNSNNQEVLKAIELLTGRTPKTEEEWDERMPLTLKLVNVINEKGLDVDKICEYYKVKTTNELSDEQIKEIIETNGGNVSSSVSKKTDVVPSEKVNAEYALYKEIFEHIKDVHFCSYG